MRLQKNNVIHGVDLLRFVSAMLVVVFHLGYWIGRPGSSGNTFTHGQFLFPWAQGTASVGRVGVQIFFVISGFVIAYSARGSSAGSFLRSRILRLMPAAWICGTITLIVALIVGGQSKGKLIDAWAHSVFFLPKGPYIDGAYWTLAIECAFYAIFLALIVFKSLRQIERIFCAIAVINALFCLTIFVIRPELHGLFENRLLQLMLVVHGGSFAVGIFLRGLLFEGPTALRLMGLVIGLVGGGLGVGYWVALPEDVVPSLTIWFLSVGLIAASVRFNDRLQLALDNHSLTTVRNFGLATYPLYLVHNILGAALMMRLAEVGLPHLACLVLTLIALIIVALFIAVYIEPVVRAVMRAPLEKLQLGLNNLWKTVIVRSLHVSN